MEMIIYVKHPHKSFIPSLFANTPSQGDPPPTPTPTPNILEDFRMKPSFTLSLLKKDISRRMSIPLSQISFSNMHSSLSSLSSPSSSSSSPSPSSPPPPPPSNSNSSNKNNNNTYEDDDDDDDSKTISESGIVHGTILELNTQGKIVVAVLRTNLKLVNILIVDPDNTKISDLKQILVDAPALREMGEKPLSMTLKRPWPAPVTMWGFDDGRKVKGCMTDEQLAAGGVTFTVGELRYADRDVEELSI